MEILICGTVVTEIKETDRTGTCLRMTEPRKSTVFDYSDLRLHPDGTRVYQKSTNLRPKLAQSTIRGARSNWIATDAGGSLRVPLFRKRKTEILEEEAEAEFKDENIGPSGSACGGDPPVEDEDEDGKRSSRRPDHRKAKRQKFLKNVDYLADASPPDPDVNVLSLPHPSPDLLKCIHRFTSEFYHERGQLLNSSRQYRKERKERRIQRALERSSSPASSSSESRSNKSAEKLDEYEDGPDDDTSEDGGGAATTSTTVGTKGRKRRKGRRRCEKHYVDMYKVFDGSAMMALGMLVQEHIAHLLKPSIPESWEEEIRSAYTDPWCESPQLEGDGEDGEAGRGSPEGGKKLQGVVAGDKDTQSSADSPKEIWASEENDESSRSDDTRHSSDSEDDYS